VIDRYNAAISQLNNKLIAIENAIETLEPRERQALRLHYIDGLTWEEVGYKMYYERSQIFRIRKKAIEKLKNA
jgi:RNA polymerase sigma factor (sigma-70 family)